MWYDELKDPQIRQGTHELPAPLLYKAPSSFQATKQGKAKKDKHVSELKIKKGWELAMAPVKSLPMTLFMNYMTGNSLQIISISMTFMLFVTPIKALFNINETFAFLEHAEDEVDKNDVYLIKLAFVAAQFLGLGVGLWKLNAMGLIPNSRSDWLAWENAPHFVEHFVSVHQ